MGVLPTVKIQAENSSGFVVINESDFDSKVHKLFKEPKPEKKNEEPEKKVDSSKAGKKEIKKDE